MNKHWQRTAIVILASVISSIVSAPHIHATGPDAPLVQVGQKNGQTPIELHGPITQSDSGTLNLPGDGEWGWVAVGTEDKPLPTLEGLRSFTICGWAGPGSLQTGSGGNRIAFNLNYNQSGFDLVHLNDGRMRLAVNQWPDQVKNDSSTEKLQPGQWTFFAVTYDETKQKNNVHWYFGKPDSPVTRDRATTYSVGPTGNNSGPLTVGNYNTTLHRSGMDRQFRGRLHGIRIYGSKTGADGALDVPTLRQIQADIASQPDFSQTIPKMRSTPPLHSNQQTDAAQDGAGTPMPKRDDRPKIIATTDGEIDDRCSMIRFLLYNNQWDIQGIIHSSSKFHWKGDGDKIARHNWADEVWLDKQLDAYETIYPQLAKHDNGFYTPDELRKLIYTGNIENVGEMEKVTPGSTQIVEILLQDDPAPVYLQAWGGTNTIARALKTIQQDHPEAMDRVSQKAILYLILDQDKTFREYIEPNWPELQTLGSFGQFAAIAYSWDRLIPEELHAFYDRSWMEENILHGHGPLCASYEAHPQKGFRSEGDSPSFMHQIPVGLRSLEHPGYGGWGGRFIREKPGSATWRDARDGGDLSKPIWRFSEAFQNDWAARADWCVRDPDKANHPPQPRVVGSLDRTAPPGERVSVSAKGSSDPDGDALTFKWWQYIDVDSCKTTVDISTLHHGQTAEFVVPNEPGSTVHLILELTDDGNPALTRYHRVIVTVAE
ncbi:hypothetical protein CA13_56980 [Planctomycetes bacterium CA13]|uniref:DUF1593 domain-containing protein n=1 Tax=Novipirellula herctigrandis TaxID=2527986 RepID=A0A5C5ZA69_9BACT|nr:hypothetical protein CA13_56980 [Planctomycetes bacterium CA13]